MSCRTQLNNTEVKLRKRINRFFIPTNKEGCNYCSPLCFMLVFEFPKVLPPGVNPNPIKRTIKIQTMATRNSKTEKIRYQSGRTKIDVENPGRETFRIILMDKIFKILWFVLTTVALYLLADKTEAITKVLPSVRQQLVGTSFLL